MATESGENPFWDYSLALYQRPGIAPLLLDLQDRLGADVNLLLFCCWAGSRGRALRAEDFSALDAEVARWRAQVIHAFRGLRRALKPLAEDDARIADLRERVKASELDAERIEQDLLHANLAIAEGQGSAELCRKNLETYLVWLGAGPPAEEAESLIELAAAAQS